MKTIVLNPAAARSPGKLPQDIRGQVQAAMHSYAMFGSGDPKAMAGTPTVRLRSGDYRIIFDEAPDTITILALGHRRDIYR